MNKHEIVNLIIEKFGGNRVKFVEFWPESIDFVLGHNLYRCGFNNASKTLLVVRLYAYHCATDNYSRWVEGVLNGMTRNDDGELVQQ